VTGRKPTIALGVLWLALAACGGAAHPPSPAARARAPEKPTPDAGAAAKKEDPAIEHGDFAHLDARELAPMSARAFARGDLRGSAESAAPPGVSDDPSGTQLTLPMGTAPSVNCIVYRRPIDPGAALLGVLDALRKNIDVQTVTPADVVAVGEYAATFVDAEFTAKTAKGTLAGGAIKLVAYAHPVTPLVCMQEGVGYHKTFERVVTGLAASLERVGEKPPPSRFVELDIERIGGHPCGFMRSELTDGAKGSRVFQLRTLTLLARSPTDLIATDSSRTDAWDASGYIAFVDFVQRQGADVSERITLKRSGAHAYAYDGEYLGKKVRGTLRTKGAHGLEGDGRLYPKLGRLVASGGELHSEGYLPDVDPTSALDVVYRVASKEDRTVTMDIGKLTMKLRLDASGHAERGEMPLGAVTFAFGRVFTRGAL
jgi:hypothetical protein